jgi:hypothetical protein
MRAIHSTSKIPGYKQYFSGRYLDTDDASMLVSYDAINEMKKKIWESYEIPNKFVWYNGTHESINSSI